MLRPASTCIVNGADATKSQPVFIHMPDSSSFPPPSNQPPFSPAIQRLLSPGQQAIQNAVAGQRQAVSCQLSERAVGERESVNKALLPSNQLWSPPHSLTLCTEKQAGHEKVHSKRVIITDYYGMPPAGAITVISERWLVHTSGRVGF